MAGRDNVDRYRQLRASGGERLRQVKSTRLTSCLLGTTSLVSYLTCQGYMSGVELAVYNCLRFI